MKKDLQSVCGGRRAPGLRRMLLLTGVSLLTAARLAGAHDLFTAYIQHNVSVAVGARHVDVVVELTFFEEWSGRERGRMDADGNGRITRPELEAYVKTLAQTTGEQVALVIAGTRMDLIPLYEPEVDLLASDKAGSDHHRVRLCFFAPTPSGLLAGGELLVEDRLWPQARALGMVQAEGRDGCVLAAEKPKDPGFAPARPGEARVFKVRCVKPPASPPAAAVRKQAL